jgi:hypothetical protein
VYQSQIGSRAACAFSLPVTEVWQQTSGVGAQVLVSSVTLSLGRKTAFRCNKNLGCNEQSSDRLRQNACVVPAGGRAVGLVLLQGVVRLAWAEAVVESWIRRQPQ